MIKSNAILEVNLKNLIHNYESLSKISNKSLCAATVKANAYGVGVLKIFDQLYKKKCRHFFVATLEEGLFIRKKRSHGIIYVLNGMEGNKIKIFNQSNLIPILNTESELELFLLKKNDKKINIGIHVDTGLNRLGISLNYLKKNNINKLKFKILISHMSSADELNNKYNLIQNNKFKESINYIENIEFISLSNSMGILLGKDYHYDLVRPGIALYGGHFGTRMKNVIKPIIKLKAKVLQIKEINKNEFVGYNQTFKTKKRIFIAIIGIGYADGISRKLSNNGAVYFKDKVLKIVGRVSMDSITVDIKNNLGNLKEGDYVEIINYKYDINYIAKKSQTICDEILTSISNRVQRIYV